MEQRFIDDVRMCAENICEACTKLEQLNELRYQFKNGKTATVKFEIDGIGFCETAIKADGKNLFADEIFNNRENGLRFMIDEYVQSLQTFLEVESAE